VLYSVLVKSYCVSRRCKVFAKFRASDMWRRVYRRLFTNVNVILESSSALLLERQLSLAVFYFNAVLLLGDSISANILLTSPILLLSNCPEYSFFNCAHIPFSLLRECVYMYMYVCVCVYGRVMRLYRPVLHGVCFPPCSIVYSLSSVWWYQKIRSLHIDLPSLHAGYINMTLICPVVLRPSNLA
jgi:hypothetical protein